MKGKAGNWEVMPPLGGGADRERSLYPKSLALWITRTPQNITPISSYPEDFTNILGRDYTKISYQLCFIKITLTTNWGIIREAPFGSEKETFAWCWIFHFVLTEGTHKRMHSSVFYFSRECRKVTHLGIDLAFSWHLLN